MTLSHNLNSTMFIGIFYFIWIILGLCLPRHGIFLGGNLDFSFIHYKNLSNIFNNIYHLYLQTITFYYPYYVCVLHDQGMNFFIEWLGIPSCVFTSVKPLLSSLNMLLRVVSINLSALHKETFVSICFHYLPFVALGCISNWLMSPSLLVLGKELSSPIFSNYG